MNINGTASNLSTGLATGVSSFSQSSSTRQGFKVILFVEQKIGN